MIIDKNITRVTIGNTEIQKIMSGGGILWQRSRVPGPTKLIGGNLQAGFYGEVPTKDFITGDELARMIGLTEGVSQYSEEPWLKFSYLGKVEFIAKKHYRIKVSSHALYSAGAMLGRRSIKINGKVYKVRLMKGKNEGSQDDSSSYRGSIVMRSEWNRLMYPIYETQYFYNNQYKYNVSETDPPEHWGVNYNGRDLDIWRSTLCQDNGYNYRDSHERINAGIYLRGGGLIDDSYYREDDGPYFAWRPVLELVD